MTSHDVIMWLFGFVISWWVIDGSLPLASQWFATPVRAYLPGHQKKLGIPSCGGLLVIILMNLLMLLVIGWDHPLVWLLDVGLLSFGLLGLIDDYYKIKGLKGISSRMKFTVQSLMALIISYLLAHWMGSVFYQLYLPGDGIVEMGKWAYVWSVWVMVSSCNGINISDGLDGLATGVVLMVLAGFICLTWLISSPGLLMLKSAGISQYLLLLIAVLSGFFLHNRYPAKIFLGDCGSLALGGVLGMLAIISKQEVSYICFMIIPIIELLSVIFQVFGLRVLKRRLLLISPLHHHYEQKKIAETNIVYAFYGVTLVGIMLGLGVSKLLCY